MVSLFFKHRDKLFSDNNVKDLNSSFSSFEYKVDSSRIYSLVRVGYDKQDYESMNGRDEFRFTTEYTTGIDITDNVLELISPYRADVYGIEFLSQREAKIQRIVKVTMMCFLFVPVLHYMIMAEYKHIKSIGL